MSRSLPLIGLIGVLVLGGCAKTYVPGATINDFAKKHIEIINTKDRKMYLESFHPKVRESSAIFMMFFDRNFNGFIEHKIPENHQISIVTISPDQPLPYEGKLKYVVRPTHQVNIDFLVGENKSKRISAFTVEFEGKWWQVLPVPTFELLQKMKEERRNAQKK